MSRSTTDKWLNTIFKKCKHCDTNHLICNFGFTDKLHLGLKSKCKYCVKLYNYKNSKKYITQRKIRYNEDSEYRKKILNQSKKSNLKNKKLIQEKNKEYYIKNKDKIQKNNSKNYKIDYAINSDKYKQKHYNYVKNDPKNYKTIRLKYKQSNKGKLTQKILDNNRRELKLNINENYNRFDINYTFNLFDHKCFNCDTKDGLEIDHHKPLSKGFGLTRTNAVVLCRQCNAKKNNKDPQNFYTNQQLKLLKELLIIT